MPRESKASKRKRVGEIIERLRDRYPHVSALNWDTPMELLAATILSAQCTDERVNLVTAELFEELSTPEDFAGISQAELERRIRSTGFFRNKAKNIRAAARKIVDDYGGEVPDEMDDLLTLPGVARKTANVVLGDAFGKVEGIVVDTHVQRLAQRLKLTSRKNNQGDKMEKDLTDLVDRSDWIVFSHLMVYHGRAICTARKPDCDACEISDLCPSAFKV